MILEGKCGEMILDVNGFDCTILLQVKAPDENYFFWNQQMKSGFVANDFISPWGPFSTSNFDFQRCWCS